jgi:hypothetical protein
MSNHVYDKLRIGAQVETPKVAELGLPITCFVYVEDVSPFRPLRLQLDSYRRYGTQFDRVLQDHWLFENLKFTARTFWRCLRTATMIRGYRRCFDSRCGRARRSLAAGTNCSDSYAYATRSGGRKRTSVRLERVIA